MSMEMQLAPHLSDQPSRKAKWDWLTEGIQRDGKDSIGKSKRVVTEIMLDNMEAEINRQLQSGHLTEDTLAAATGAFTTFAYPLVRRVYPKLISQELFTVQPMSQPTGKVFFLDFTYNDSPDAGNRLDVTANFDKDYATSTEGGTVKAVNLGISSITITAEQKKLKAIWSIEAQQDLAAYHGLDMESELMQVLADEIVREIDRILINDAVTNATAGNINFNVNGSPSTLPTEQRAWNEKLYEAIIDANNLIFKKRYKNATWILADTDTCARLEKLNGFKLASISDTAAQIQDGGRHLFGTLQNRWMIYKDPWFTANTMFLGFKGSSFLDAGYVYSPFVPFWTTPLFIDPNDMKPRRGIMSRYAKQMVVGDMFSTVTLTTS